MPTDSYLNLKYHDMVILYQTISQDRCKGGFYFSTKFLVTTPTLLGHAQYINNAKGMTKCVPSSRTGDVLLVKESNIFLFEQRDTVSAEP